MKKILPWIIGFLGILILTGCGGNSIKDTLTTDGGEWEAQGFGTSTKVTFYKDGDFSLTESGSNYAGTYEYNEKDNKLTTTINNVGKQIFTDLKEQDGKITAIFGEKKVTFEKAKKEN